MSPMVSQTPLYQLEKFLTLLAQQPAVLVQVDAAQGSVPRDAGAWMAVFANSLVGTIGGGHLEHEAIAKARMLLQMQPEALEPEVMKAPQHTSDKRQEWAQFSKYHSSRPNNEHIFRRKL